MEAGHTVRLATVEFSGKPLDRLKVREFSKREGGFKTSDPEVLEIKDGKLAPALQEQIDEFKPAAIVGCTDLINRELAQLKTDIPLWCDYFGDPMAERQMLAHL